MTALLSSPRHLLPALLLLVSGALALHAADSLDLAGTWRFQLDRANVGVSEHWYQRPLTGTFALPGSLPERGIGDPVTPETKWTGGIIDRSWFTSPEAAPYRQRGNVKVPFWLQPETYYAGVAWFQRDIDIPASWAHRRVTLVLERPHWKTAAWLDDTPLGTNDSLSVPHEYVLGVVASGHHRLTVRVDNTFDPDIGENSHSMSDHTQGNWNGIVGRIELRATAPVWIDDVEVYPRIGDRVAVVRGRIATTEGQSLPARVHVTAGPLGAAAGPAKDASVGADGRFALEYPLGATAALWDEFNPALDAVTVALDSGEKRTVTFGLRELSTAGRRLQINGRPLFLRGTLDCAAYPRTGHPPLDVATWKRVLGTIKAHGLNHVRFHSWCPPESAFVAADELGVYVQVEVSSWPNQSTTLGDGKPVDAWIERETARILRVNGNHPSFTMLAAGNEPGGDHTVPWLTGWVTAQKTADPRRLYTDSSGWPELPVNDYSVTPEPRIQHWGEGLNSRINRAPPETRTDYRDFIFARREPIVSHEIGQWCVYPNFAEMPKYTGYLKPRNFEIFRASLAAHGMLDEAPAFLLASGRLQALCYKEDIESALRTPQMGGFQLLGLSDFPGQGTALVGVLDAFWEEKGYVSPAEFRRFCNSTVPLARLDRRVFTTDEVLTADIEVAHYGPTPLRATGTTWKLVGDHHRVAGAGRFAARDIPLGGPTALGRLDLALGHVPAPARYKLVVALEGTSYENDWDVWVYPPATQVIAPPPADVTIASELDAAAAAKLTAGGTVFLMIPPDRVQPDPQRGKIALGFSSIFWNTSWTGGQAPHTLGILCDPHHPALADFPTDASSNWQWWYPVTHAGAMLLDGTPTALRPIVQVIDNWFTNRKLGLVFEARVGTGRLLVTSIDLQASTLDPVRRQLRASLLRYAASPEFRPANDVTVAQIRQLYTP